MEKKNKTKDEVDNYTKKKKRLLILLFGIIGIVAMIIVGIIWNKTQSGNSVANNTLESSTQTDKDDKKDNKQDKKNDQKKDDKKDSTSKNDKKADEKKNDVKETENKTETSNNSGNTNSTNNSTSTVKPSNNTSTNNTTTTTTKPSNTTSTTTNNSNNSSNNSSSQPTGCTPVYETVTVTDVPAQPIYGEEQYLISAEEPIYQDKSVYMTSDGVQFESGQEEALGEYCIDHDVSYYVTYIKVQVGTKPAQYGTRQVVTGYTEPVTHTEQRQVDCK